MRLIRIIFWRLASAVPVVFLVSLGSFGLFGLLPGEPARALAGGDLATPEDIARVREQLGLDDPFLVRYFRWLGGALRFDFGDGLSTGQSVSSEIVDRMPATLSIALVAVVVAVIIGTATGIWSGARPGTVADKLSTLVATIGVSIPSFVLAIILVQTFSIRFKLVPAVGFVPFGDSPVEWFKSVLLPGVSLGAMSAGALSRQLRSGLVDALQSSYVRTQWSVGSGVRNVVGKHALKNSSIPAVAVLGSQMTFLFGGTVVIERIFSVRGVGTYMFESATNADLPALQGIIMWFVFLQLAVFLVVDIVLVILNPRIDLR